MTKRHTIEPGDCIASIALAHGLHPETVWEHADNEELRSRRESGYLLVPGDVLAVPELRPAEFACATGQRHVFRRLGVPEKLQIRLEDSGQPRADLDYVLVVDGNQAQGRTDADGLLIAWISPDARRAELRIDGEAPLAIALGRMTPATDERGVRDRLVNLGYLAEEDADDTEQAWLALRRFQDARGLPDSGVADDDTRAALVDAYGC